MKFSTVAATLAAAGLVAAEPHRHQHRHIHHKRTAASPDSTVFEFELNGHQISEEKVCRGIEDGSLMWADGHAPLGACQSSSSTPTPTPTPTPSPAGFLEKATSLVDSLASSHSIPGSISPSIPTEIPTEIPTTIPTKIPNSKPSSSSDSTTKSDPSNKDSSNKDPTSIKHASNKDTSNKVSTPASNAGGAGSSSSSAKGVDAEFPDGQIDCSTFPSDYGAVPLDYLGLGGWSGVQYVSFLDNMIGDIVTAVTGDTCHDGAMCSYACPPGYQKAQWPSTQGSTGQSVGGVQCKGDKLYLTNPGLSKTLCVPGVGGVFVKNTMPEQAAVCRTDYPGTEAETIPLAAISGSTQPLTCPDGASYFTWEGQTTSAQYYVNPKGVSTEVGCQWGDGSQPVGNWAPINLGVGQVNGKWLSIFQNSPTTNKKLDFNVKITGDNLSGDCRYENGKFYSDTTSNDSGCTTEVLSGDAYYVFY